MAKFDQRGQYVHTQFNAENLTVGTINTQEDVVTALEFLKRQLIIARSENQLSAESKIQADDELEKIDEELKTKSPNVEAAKGSLSKLKKICAHIDPIMKVLTRLALAISLLS